MTEVKTRVQKRQHQRIWTIRCANGEFQTVSMRRADANAVALWCDEHHPKCGPHKVRSRETRTWAGRVEAGTV